MGFYFTGEGRVSRKDFWLRWVLVYLGLVVLAAVVDHVAFADMTARLNGSGPLGTILGFLLIWPSFAVSAKRFHDRGMSGWWPLWLMLISIGLVIVMIVGLVMSGFDVEALAAGIAPDMNELNGGGLAVFLISLLALLGVGLFQLIVLGFLPGQKGPNKYGPDPLQPEQSQAA